MSNIEKRLAKFVSYAKLLRGDEKGEAQVFCDRLFQGFGHQGYKEAGAILEDRQRHEDRRTRFVDLVWKPRLLLEMKKRGANLHRHYSQAFHYWERAVPNRPRYVILCNFDEFWIYDFDLQLDEPVDRVLIQDLPTRYPALNFLFPEEKRPQFGNDRIAVTRAAADKVATVFNSLTRRGEAREKAQRFILQCVVAMFSEDFGLLPKGLFTELIEDCDRGKSTYDLFGALFTQMNSPRRTEGGRFRDVAYFNGGLFSVIQPIDLKSKEITLLKEASAENWGMVQPAVFGTLFQSSMDTEYRHALGAHYTSEADIQKVVLPTISEPWRKRIQAAESLKDFIALRKDILEFRVLDPACGSGNFLYVAYRELVRLEMEILLTSRELFGAQAEKKLGKVSLVRTQQFFGIDMIPFATELAKVTLMLAKQLAFEEARLTLEGLKLRLDKPLPLDNLDSNIKCDDALFCEWPRAHAIIGNPPYQSKNKMQQEYGRAYLNKLHARYPDVPGRADYCVYWFRRAHDELQKGERAGLVGTNTIRQNYSREGGLDYILSEGGTITEAVSTQVWSGDADVHVSIVNWIKGKQTGIKLLHFQPGDSRDNPWVKYERNVINAALSHSTDVTSAKALTTYATSKTCYQGQTHGHEGFLLSTLEAKSMVTEAEGNAEVLFPFLTGDELLSSWPVRIERYVIDFYPRDINAAAHYIRPFARIKQLVLPDREKAALDEERRNKEARKEDADGRVNVHHANFLKRWWLLSYPRAEMMDVLRSIPRYIACSCVTKRPIFEFISSSIHPNAALQVFPLSDDYSFGILQSSVHWAWFTARCSTLTEHFRYTSDTVFDSYPWPQSPSSKQVTGIAAAAKELRHARRSAMEVNKLCLRDLYRTLDLPGENPVRDAHSKLDESVREAYGMKETDDPLAVLLDLNLQLSKSERNRKPIIGPGVPPSFTEPARLVSNDCVQAPK